MVSPLPDGSRVRFTESGQNSSDLSPPCCERVSCLWPPSATQPRKNSYFWNSLASYRGSFRFIMSNTGTGLERPILGFVTNSERKDVCSVTTSLAFGGFPSRVFEFYMPLSCGSQSCIWQERGTNVLRRT
jgi:hypothetical protein